MASFAVLLACVLIVSATAVIARARRRQRRIGGMPVIMIVLAVGILVYTTVPPLLS